MSGGLPSNRVHIGDARALAGQLAPQSVNCIVTSPPYYGLRSYLPDDHPDKAREMGSETTPDAFVAELVGLFAALRPALRDDGTLWLNLGDTYNSGGSGGLGGSTLGGGQANQARSNRHGRGLVADCKPKDLLGLPWLVALALRADGWYLRSDIVWHKPNPMPESVTDRPTRAHEYLFLLSKSPTYYYDAEAIKEPASGGAHARGEGITPKSAPAGGSIKANVNFHSAITGLVEHRNKRSVWTVRPAAFPEAHYATFPPDLVRPCILAGTADYGCCAGCGAPWRRVVERAAGPVASHNGSSFAKGKSSAPRRGVGQGDRYTTLGTVGWVPSCRCGTTERRPAVVLDPFMGSGTTAQVATEEGRAWLGCDLDPRARGWAAARLATAQRRLVLGG